MLVVPASSSVVALDVSAPGWEDKRGEHWWRSGPGQLDSSFRLVSPHQQSIPFPYLQAPQVIKFVTKESDNKTPLFGEAWIEAMTLKNILAGFHVTGVHPLN